MDTMAQEVIAMIREGDLDDDLATILLMGKARLAEIGHQKRDPKQERVRIRKNASISPKYMLGKEFPVISWNKKTVSVGPIPDTAAYGRFAGQTYIRVPKNAVEKI